MVDWSAYFLSPQLHVWLWLLAPLILLYLIRPKPQNQTIPSLMFLLADKGKAIRNSLLRYLYRDFVFLLQILILVLLIAAAARPYLPVERTAFVGNAVIVLDASASMQAESRWDDAMSRARAALARQNTIILVHNRPLIVGKDLDTSEAEELLDDLEPADTETNLYSAIVASKDFVLGQDTVVTVISDFRETDEQQDVRAAIKAIESMGATVNAEQVGKATDNVGIVSVDVQEDKTRLGVTNYGGQAKSVKLTAGSLSQDVTLAAGATEYVTINTPPGTTEVSLNSKDDFSLDDKAYIANNPNLAVKILVITNEPKVTDAPFYYALQSINDKTPLQIGLTVNNPPAIPTPKDFDVVIFYKVNPQLLVQRTVRDTADAVAAGKAAIIMSQDSLFSLNFEGMLPYEYVGEGQATAVVQGAFSPITQNVEFGDVLRYAKVNGTGKVLAQASADNSPLIALITHGQGKILYYGIDDSVASFSQEPYYPVFWKRVLDELGGRVSLDKLNVKTGTASQVAGAPKKLPENFQWTGFYDKQGVYTYSDRTVVANLASAAESKITPEPFSKNAPGTVSATSSLKNQEFTSLFILASLALLFLELFIVKYRGDF